MTVRSIAMALLLGGCEVAGDDTCYSPDQNVEDAYVEGALGCACDNDEPQCIDGVGLVCDEGWWQSVEDGPCMP